MSSSDGDAPPPRPDRSRSKPPLTIDLEAQREASASERPAEEVRAEAEAVSAAAASAASAEAQSLPPPPPSPAPEGQSGQLRLGLAAIGGGVVALLLVLLLQGVGLWPVPRDPAAANAANLAAALKREVEGLQAAQNRDATADRTFGERIGRLEAGVAELEKRLADVGARVDARPAVAAPASQGPDPELAQRVADLANRVAAVERAASASSPPVDIEPLRRQVAELAARVGEIASRPPPASDRAAYAMALGAVRQAAARGAPFANELGLLRPLARDAAAVDALNGAAVRGVKSRETLLAEFPTVGAAILAALEPAPSGGWLDRLTGHARSLVTIRPSGPVAGATPDAVVSRMRAKVAAGDLAGALQEREALPEPGKAASADFAREASARLDLDQRLEALARSGPAGSAGQP